MTKKNRFHTHIFINWGIMLTSVLLAGNEIYNFK